jgi:hypothetical protein
MAGTPIADPLAAGFAVGLGGDELEDILRYCQLQLTDAPGSSYFDIWPGLLVATRYDAGAVSSTLFSSGNTSAHKADAFLRQVLGAAVGVRVMRVATVDDDVALLDAALIQEQLDEVFNRLSSHDEHHHASGLLEHQVEIVNRVSADNSLTLGCCSTSVGDP